VILRIFHDPRFKSANGCRLYISKKDIDYALVVPPLKNWGRRTFSRGFFGSTLLMAVRLYSDLIDPYNFANTPRLS
jgi:hypothetical protein